jgi:hypothetical protein
VRLRGFRVIARRFVGRLVGGGRTEDPLDSPAGDIVAPGRPDRGIADLAGGAVLELAGVKCVSDPEASNTNGSRPSTVSAFSRTSAGRPVAYIADRHSTPLSGMPCGLATMTPTARLSTYRR